MSSEGKWREKPVEEWTKGDWIDEAKAQRAEAERLKVESEYAKNALRVAKETIREAEEAGRRYLRADYWVQSAYAAAGTSPDEQIDAETELRAARDAFAALHPDEKGTE